MVCTSWCGFFHGFAYEGFHRMWDVIELTVRGYTMWYPVLTKNTKMLWTASRSPFPGKSPHRVFLFNAMFFIMNFQLVIKAIKVIISWAENAHRGHRRPTPSLILQLVQQLPWVLHALGMLLDVFLTVQQLSRMCRKPDLLSVILYLFLFLYTCLVNYSFGEEKDPNNLELTCS